MHKNARTSKFSRITAIGAGFLLPAIAAKAARHSAGHIYRATTQKDAPRNPASSGVSWKEALIWAIVAGTVGAVARLTTMRMLPLIGLPSQGFDMEKEVDEIDD